MSVDTLLQNYVCKPLLKPLSANCTIGISIKSNAETQSTIAICVHSDFQPIVISLSDDQVSEMFARSHSESYLKSNPFIFLIYYRDAKNINYQLISTLKLT